MPYALQCLCPDCKAEGHIYDGRYFLAPSSNDIIDWQRAMRIGIRVNTDALSRFLAQRGNSLRMADPLWSIPDHGYTHWYRMFNPRQLLVHAEIAPEDHDGRKCAVCAVG